MSGYDDERLVVKELCIYEVCFWEYTEYESANGLNDPLVKSCSYKDDYEKQSQSTSA